MSGPKRTRTEQKADPRFGLTPRFTTPFFIELLRFLTLHDITRLQSAAGHAAEMDAISARNVYRSYERHMGARILTTPGALDAKLRPAIETLRALRLDRLEH